MCEELFLLTVTETNIFIFQKSVSLPTYGNIPLVYLSKVIRYKPYVGSVPQMGSTVQKLSLIANTQHTLYLPTQKPVSYTHLTLPTIYSV